MNKLICGLAIFITGQIAFANIVLTGDDPNSYSVVYLTPAKDVYFKTCSATQFPKSDCAGEPSLGISKSLFDKKLVEFGKLDAALVKLQSDIRILDYQIENLNEQLKVLTDKIQSEKKSIEFNQQTIEQLETKLKLAKQKLASGGISAADKAELQKFIDQSQLQILERQKSIAASRTKIVQLDKDSSSVETELKKQQSELAQKKTDKSLRLREIDAEIANVQANLAAGRDLVTFVNETAFFLSRSVFDLQKVSLSECKLKSFALGDGVGRASVSFELATGLFPVYPKSLSDSRRLELKSQNDLDLVYDKGSWIQKGAAFSFISPILDRQTKKETAIDCSLPQKKVPNDLKFVGQTASYLYAGRFNRKQIIAVCKAATGGRSADGYNGYIFGSSDSLGYRSSDIRNLMDSPPALMSHTRVDNLPPLKPGRYAWSYQPGCCGGGDGNYIFNFDQPEEDSRTRRPEWLSVDKVFASNADTVELPTICSGNPFDRY